MTEGASVLRGVLECPEDRTLRLVFADWLDEHDQGDQAEVIGIGAERHCRERSGLAGSSARGIRPRLKDPACREASSS
jgi:uncharacterized protein (TIGR02996 family)